MQNLSSDAVLIGTLKVTCFLFFLYECPNSVWLVVFLFFFYLILYVPSTIFQLNRDVSSLVEPVLSYDKCVLLKDHNTVMLVRLEPEAPRSQVKHSTTEPLRSLSLVGLWSVIVAFPGHTHLVFMLCIERTVSIKSLKF